MTPATPVSRRRRRPSRSRTPPATRISASYDRTSSRVRARSGSAPPWLRTKRATPAPTSSPTSPSTVGGDGPAPGERRQPLRPRIEADRQPVAGDGEAGPQVVGTVGDRRRSGRPGSPRRRRPAGSPRPSRRRRRPGAGRRPGPRPRRPRRGWPATPARAPSKSTRWIEPRPERHEPLGDPVGPVGRRADAGPGARPVDDPRAAASRSMAGMTCTSRSGPGRQQPPVEADRQRAVPQQRVVEAP